MKNVDAMLERYYVEVWRNDGRRTSGTGETLRDGNGHLVALVVQANDGATGKTSPVVITWHAVSAIEVVNERGKTT